MLEGLDMNPYRILIADDHALIRDGIRKILAGRTDLEVIGEAGDGLELLDLLRSGEAQPDMIILDISMPNLAGIEAAWMVKRSWPDVKILIMTLHKEKDYMVRARAAGLEGYLLKEEAVPQLLAAIDVIRQGGIYLPANV
jgi:DNA-binding NarL/FixJ family response regulator